MVLIYFNNGVPDFLYCEGGKISITNKQYKNFKASLCWEFNNGDRLIFRTDIGYKAANENSFDNRENTFCMYLFSNGAKGTLDVSFAKDSKKCTMFKINLGYTGWRHVAACFDRDMTGVPCEKMDCLVITACGEGCVLLDEILTCGFADYRHVAASKQLPFIQNKVVDLNEEFSLKSEWKPKEINKDEINEIYRRYRLYVINEYDCKASEQELLKKADSLGVREDIYGCVGERVEHYLQRAIFKGTDGENKPYKTLRSITDLMCHLAVRYAKIRNKSLLERYVLILKHLINQGLAFGSTLGSHSGLDYSMRPLYFSLVVLLDEKEIIAFREELCKLIAWFTHFERCGLCEGQKIVNSTTDDFFNLAPGIMTISLMMPDYFQKAWYLKAVSKWLDFNMQYTDGLSDMFKDDGCIYHHAGHYPAYGNGALTGIAPILYAFGKTSFDVSETARTNMKNVLLSLRFQSAGLMFATAFSGRHPFKNSGINIIPYRYFAKYELLNNDLTMAKVYLRLMKGKTTPADEDIIKSKAAPEEIPSGNRSFPMACANVHRRDDWMLVSKGFSRYIWGNESYVANNLYGRYISYGTIELYTDVENTEKRYSEDGFCWSRFPGTTSIRLPLEKLRAQIYNLDNTSGFEEMLISDQSFAGANSLGNNGMFSMILTEHPKYNGSFCAYKSVFAKDDFILAMGSGITCKSEYEVETTMFQNRILQGDRAVEKADNKITDNLGNIYYTEQKKINISEGKQFSLSAENDNPTEGEFAVAVISHGVNPENESYVFGIGVNGAGKPDYEIIRQDKSAHIVRIENITYMSIFVPGVYEDISTDIPILIIKEVQEDCVKYAVSNPDLDLYKTDEDQFDENGCRKEVSIYSRKWLNNPVGGKKANLKLCENKYSFYLRGGDIVTVDV